jgi:hypothetical protein
MNGTYHNSIRNQIVRRIIQYYDLGITHIYSILKRISADLGGNEQWQALFEPTGSHLSGERFEADIIEEVLASSGRTGFVDDSDEVDAYIATRWETGCRDLQRIVHRTIRWLREQGDFTTDVDEAMVRAVVTRMGYIV